MEKQEGAEMQSIGIARKLDKLGRIVVPSELRWELGWGQDELLELTRFGSYVLLQKWGRQRLPEAGLEPASPLAGQAMQLMNALGEQDVLLIIGLMRRLANAPPAGQNPAKNV